MIGLFPSGIDWRELMARSDFKVYFQKGNVGNRLRACANRDPRLFHRIDLRQYSVFGHAHGYCGWYNR
jgi:hypothetical protein